MTERVPPAEIDRADGDWIKRGHWDLPVHDLGDLYEWLYLARIPPEEFKKLDVYLGNVNEPGMEWLKDL